MATPLSKAQVNLLRKFHHKKMRESEGRYLLEGWHLLEEAVRAGVAIRVLIFDAGRELGVEETRVLKAAAAIAEEVLEGNDRNLVQIVNTRTSQGVVALVDRRRTEWSDFKTQLKDKETIRLVALDTVGDPGNCGTILRAASWFGLDGVIFGEGCAELENDKVIRASMGAVFQLPVTVGTDLLGELRALKREGFSILGSSLSGQENLEEFTWPQKSVLVIGNEARGLSDAVAGISDSLLKIPRFGAGESLNAGVAASVFFAKWRMG